MFYLTIQGEAGTEGPTGPPGAVGPPGRTGSQGKKVSLLKRLCTTAWPDQLKYIA